MTDDGIREVHGVTCRTVILGERSSIVIRERDEFIKVDELHSQGRELTEWQARYLAAKLYRLSRRIRNRREQVPS